MSANIFVSFASGDRALVERLVAHIEARGFSCWVADRDVPAGDNYQEAITRALRGSKVLLSLISLNANNSIEMQKELSLASRYKLTVMPLRLENVEPNDAFLYEFATRQWIDLFRNWNGGCEKLLNELASLAQAERAAPRPQPAIRGYGAAPSVPPSRARAPDNRAELPKALAQSIAATRPSVRRDVIPPRPAPTLGTRPITGISTPVGPAVGAKPVTALSQRTDKGDAIGPAMAALAALGFAVVLALSVQHGDVSPLELLFWAILLTGCARLLGSLVRLALYGTLTSEA